MLIIFRLKYEGILKTKLNLKQLKVNKPFKILCIVLLFACFKSGFAQQTRFTINGQNASPTQAVSVCVNTPVTFENTSTGSFTDPRWIFNGGNPQSGVGNTVNNVIFSTPGTDSATLIVTRGNSSDTLKVPLLVVANNVKAEFISSPSGQCANVPVSFTNQSTGGPGLAYSWLFDDPNSGATNNTSTQTNPTHRFVGTPGNNNETFSVRLIARNTIGCADTVRKNVTVKRLPGTELLGSNATAYQGKTFFRVCTSNPSSDVVVINQSSTAATNTLYRIKWGDGSPDYVNTTFVNQTRNFPVGIYDLAFIVTGGNGCIDTANYGVFVGSNPAVGLGNPGNTSICTGSTLTFPISNTATNPPGTFYTVTFNDGSNPLTLQHPAPSSVTHQFDRTSCGTSSGNFLNSFQATITATNPCLSSQATVVPIYVSEKARAIIGISPRDTVCTGITVNVNDNSGNISFINGSTCSEGRRVWSISPSTGYTVSGGTFGNDNNFPADPSFWTSGSASFNLNFTQPGIYTLKLRVGNPVCGRDSVVRTICVNPAPVANFTPSTLTGCAPLTVSTINTSNSPNCETNTYQWSVSYTPTPGCTPSVSDFTLQGGTTLTSAAPIFRFNNPGTYTVSLVTRNSGGICASAPFTQQIVVKDKPNANFSLPAAICQGGTINLNATSNNCGGTTATGFNWEIPGGNPAVSTVANPGTIQFNAAGNPTIRLTATNECGATTVERTLLINPTPEVSVPADVALCRGQVAGPFTFTTQPANATITWTNTNTAIGIPASGSGNINAFTAGNVGNASITVRPVLGTCSGTSKTFSISVNPLPEAPVAPPVPNYCVGDVAQPLSATALQGHTLRWYTIATGGTALASAPTPSTLAAGTTSWWVSQVVNATGCEGPRSQVMVTVYAIPTLTNAIGNNPTTCAANNGSIILSGLQPNTSYSVSYSRNGVQQTANLTSNAAGNITIASLVAGVYDNIRVSIGGGCASAPRGPVSLSDPTPPATPVAGSNGPVCVGNTLNLTATSTTPGALVYTWSGPNGFNSNLQNPSIGNVQQAAAGTYSVTARLGNCTSPAATVQVVVNPTPTVTVTSNSPVCSGNPINLSASSPSSGIVYAWTGPDNFSSSDQNPTIASAAAVHAGTYRVTGTLGACPSPERTVQVVVNPTPTIGTVVPVNPTNCATATGSIQLTGLAANTSYTVTYNRDGIPQTAIISSTVAGTLTIPNLVAGTYSDIKVSSNGCTSASVGPVSLSDPTPPATPVAGSNGPVCVGNTLNLTATSATPGALVYTWSGPNGFNSNLQNPSIGNVQQAAAGTYSVTARLGNCTSPAATVQVVVNPTPTVTVTSNSPVCSGNPINLSASSPSSGIVYAWTGPDNFSSSDQNPTIASAAAVHAGTYRVTGTLGACPSPERTVQVVVNPTPTIGTVVPVNPTNCATATGSIQLTGLAANTSYTVTYNRDGIPQTAIISSNAAGNLTIPNLVAGTYSDIKVSFNGCTSASVGPVSLSDPNPPAAPQVSSNSPICIGSTLRLTAAGVGAGTYQWTGPNGFSSSAQNPEIPNATLASSGNYLVTFTVNNCTSAPATVIVSVSPNASTPNAGPDQQLCNANQTRLQAGTLVNGTGTWTVVPGSTAQVVNTSNPATEVIGLPIGLTRLVWTVTNNVCPPASDTVDIINLPPVTQVLSPRDPVICEGQSVRLNGPSPTGGTGSYQYQWQQSSNNISFTNIANAISPDYVAAPTVNTWYRRQVTSGACQHLSDTILITVRPSLGNNRIAGPTEVCSQTAPSLITGTTPTGGEGNYVYAWEQSFDGGITWSVLPNETGKDYQPPVLTQTTSYRRIVSTALCQGPQALASDMLTITVRPDALLVWQPTPLTGCTPFTINPARLGLEHRPDRNSTYHWFVNGIQVGTGLTFPGHTLTNAGDTAEIKAVALSRFGCKNDSASVVFRTISNPSPSFTMSDTVGCGPLAISFTNTTPNLSGFTYRWDFGNGQQSSAAQPGIVNFVRNPDFGDTLYTVTLYASNGCDTLSASKTLRVRAPAKAIINPDKVEGCSPARFTFANNSRGSGATYSWNFGDGSPDLVSDEPTVHYTYNTGVRRIYEVRLISSNDCGTDTARVNLVVSPNPIQVNILADANRLNGCAPHTIQFINNTIGATIFRYNFGDGTPDVVSGRQFDTILHVYASPGTYTFSMTASSGCTDTSIQRTVVVQAKPVAAFTRSTGVVCIGEPVLFTNNSSAGAAIQWSFGDGTGSGLANPQKSFTRAGTYRVTLYASNNFGLGFTCTDSASTTVIVRDTLPGNFTVVNSSNCAPFAITFKTSLPNAAATFWNFGDGTTATGDSVAHSFISAGTYTVTMVSVDAGGCAYKSVQSVVVSGPTGQLVYEAPFVCVGSSITFRAISNNTVRYIYYFGNGDSAVSLNSSFSYTYPQPGTYRPHVVLQSGNCRSEIWGADSLKVDRVRAGFLHQAQPDCGFTTLQFTENGSTVFGKGLWQWQLGDGNTSTAQNPTKVYTSEGIYNIKLVLTGISGCKDSLTLPVRVDIQKIPKGTIIGDTVGCIGQMLRWQGLVENADTQVSFRWLLGDGREQAGGATLTASYPRGGSFTVSMITQTNFGCSDTARHTVQVSLDPLVNAGPDLRICKGETVQLRVTGAATYQWSPSTWLSCANCPNPMLQATENITYVVTGFNSIGCKATDTLNIEVPQPFRITYSASDTICLGEDKQLQAGGAQRYVWSPGTGLNNATIANPVATPTITTTYRVVGYDNANCFTDTGYVTIEVGRIPTVDIGDGGTFVAGSIVPLNPRLGNGPFARYTWTPTTGLSCADCPNPIVTVGTNITYTLQVTSPLGCSASDTVSFRVVCVQAEQVYIPNAFSPDGDGVNDVFMVRGKGLTRVKSFRVFNRFGQVVFERQNFPPNDPAHGWNGTINGVPASPDVYVYVAELLCTGGASYFQKGNVTLVR
jgi:gliding motility-associated-like protein